MIYYLAFGALAVLGTFVHPLFFTFHLTEIIVRYPTLKNIISSVLIQRKPLFLVFILFIVFLYFATVLAYQFFYDDYLDYCKSMLFCFLTNFDQTFKVTNQQQAS